MLILSLQMYEHDMDLLLIMMNHHKTNNSFTFRSNSGIKYQDFFIILPNLPTIFIAIYTYSITETQLPMEMSYMTIWNNCHNNNKVTIYPTQIATTTIQTNIRHFSNTTKNNNDAISTNLAISTKAQINSSN